MLTTFFANTTESAKLDKITQLLSQRASEFSDQMERSSFAVTDVIPCDEGTKTRIAVRVDTGGELGFLQADKILKLFLDYNDLFLKQITMTRIENNIALFDVHVPLNDFVAEMTKRYTQTRELLERQARPHVVPTEFDNPCEYIKSSLAMMLKNRSIKSSTFKGYLKIKNQTEKLKICPRPGSYWSFDDTKHLANDFAEHFGLSVSHGGFPETSDGSIYISGSVDAILSQLLSFEAEAVTLAAVRME